MVFHSSTRECVCLCRFSGLEEVESELITVVQHNGGVSLMRLANLDGKKQGHFTIEQSHTYT